MKILIVGANAAGTTAAQYARLYDKKGENEIVIVEKGKYPLYSRCALPYLISGKSKLEKVIELSEKDYEKLGIDLRLNTELLSVDFSKRVARLRGEEGEYELKFDKMILATGSRARELFGKGDRIVHFRSLEDAQRVISMLPEISKVIVIGAGMIGCEVAEALRERRKEVKILEYFDRVLPTVVDPEISRRAQKVLEEHGIELSLGSKVERVEERGDKVIVKSSKGEEEGDLVICSVGISPNVEPFKEAGIKTGETGRIVVNEKMETNVPGVYAAGECTEYPEKVTGRRVPVGLGTIAFRQGMIAGINCSGGDVKFFPWILNLRVTKLFGCEISAVGPTISELKRSGIEAKCAFSRYPDLPPYYEGGEPFYSKVCVDDAGNVLSFQGFGRNAGLRANMYYLAMLNDMKIEEVAKMETAYSPPVAPIIDPAVAASHSALRKLGRIL